MPSTLTDLVHSTTCNQVQTGLNMLFLNSVSFYLLLTPLFSPYQFLLSYLIS